MMESISWKVYVSGIVINRPLIVHGYRDYKGSKEVGLTDLFLREPGVYSEVRLEAYLGTTRNMDKGIVYVTLKAVFVLKQIMFVHTPLTDGMHEWTALWPCQLIFSTFTPML